MAFRAKTRLHRCLLGAELARRAEPGALGARLLACIGAVAAEQADAARRGQGIVVRAQRQDVHHLAKQARGLPPVARLVLRGERTRGGARAALLASVDVLGVVHRAPRVLSLGLPPDLALGRGHPVARRRGQQVLGGGSDTERQGGADGGDVVREQGGLQRQHAYDGVDAAAHLRTRHARRECSATHGGGAAGRWTRVAKCRRHGSCQAHACARSQRAAAGRDPGSPRQPGSSRARWIPWSSQLPQRHLLSRVGKLRLPFAVHTRGLKLSRGCRRKLMAGRGRGRAAPPRNSR